MSLTITEALAEIKTIEKRIQKKHEALVPFIGRQDGVRDPLDKQGGSVAYLKAELQSINDLGTRIVNLRIGIAKANTTNTISTNGQTKSISDWIVWRREVAPQIQKIYGGIRSSVNNIRNQAQRTGASVNAIDAKPTDYVINLDEAELNKKIEEMEEILGNLDGQLSLKNATVIVEV